jgi:arginyl-tRNA synthetase
LNIGASENFTVICGGIGYKIGDKVAYTPLGAPLGKGKFVEPKDMKGVLSTGVMMSEKELGIEEKKDENKEEKKEKEKKEKNNKKEEGKKEEKKEKGGKKEKEQSDSANNQILILPAAMQPGQEAVEFGRKADCKIPKERKLMDELNQRKKEVKEMLLAMERGEKEICELWNKTKEWSLTEFRSIYDWLGCKFDHDFYESEVSEESRLMAKEYREKGVFVDSDGAVGADLNKFNLGFCILLKSDGAGLYATKDLALAKRKFEQFKIEKSLYVVDAAQTLHFKQVFKCLELMGYEQAKKCVHLPYGQVVLPTGRMKSRVFGSVILFSQLKKLLADDILEKFLKKYETGIEIREVEGPDGKIVQKEVPCEKWSKQEIDEALRAISVATIRFGMLNHDTAKDVVFVLEEWAGMSGATGPYMMYAYTRIRSIIREVEAAGVSGKADFSLLKHDLERSVLLNLNDFWYVVENCTAQNNPSPLCGYLFDLSKSFSSWYSHKDSSVLRAETEDLKATRVEFIKAIASVIKKGLDLLGISTIERM